MTHEEYATAVGLAIYDQLVADSSTEGYSLATIPPGREPAEHMSAETVNEPAEILVQRTMKAYGRLSQRIRRELLEAVSKATTPEDAVRAARLVLSSFLPAMTRRIAEAHLAAVLLGQHTIARRVEPSAPAIPSHAEPPIVPPTPHPSVEPHDEHPLVHLPMIKQAAKDMQERRLVTRDIFARLDYDARAKAFTVAGIEAESALGKIRDVVTETVEKGETLEAFKNRVEASLDEGNALSDAHMETVFRANVYGAYSDGMNRLLERPVVGDLFPYRAYYSIRDDRRRPEHGALEKLGLNGTNIYRADDPTWKRFLPPWAFGCRCGWVALTVKQAAERGVQEAIDWLANDRPPIQPEWVEPPPFEPSSDWVRQG